MEEGGREYSPARKRFPRYIVSFEKRFVDNRDDTSARDGVSRSDKVVVRKGVAKAVNVVVRGNSDILDAEDGVSKKEGSNESDDFGKAGCDAACYC